MKKTRLLFVINSMGLGGAQKALVTLLNELDSEKYEVDLQLCVDGGFNLAYVPEYVNVYSPFIENNEYFHRFVPLIKEQLKKLHVGVVIRRLFYAFLCAIRAPKSIVASQYYQWRFVRKYLPMNPNHYDVVIGYLDGLPHYYAIDKVNASKKICWVHNDYSKMPTYKGVFKYLSKADTVVTISPQCVSEIKKFFPKLNNVQLIYNLNSPAFIKKLAMEPLNDDFACQKGEPRILCVGRLCEQKAYHLAVEAAKILKNQGYFFNWSIIGNGEQFDTLSNMIDENDVEDVFHLLGTKVNPYPYIAAADIIVQCSIYEGKSIALDEAKILLKPIVCTDYNSARDQIEDGKTGVIVPINSEGVAEGVKKLLDNSDLREQFATTLQKENVQCKDILEQHEILFCGKSN